MDAAALDGGFADPVQQSQSSFRAVMEALANPGVTQPLAFDLMPPAPLTMELAAIALTLCDHDTPLWLDGALAAAEAVSTWLRFHTGAPLTGDPAEAQFALVTRATSLPALASFALGTDQYPDRSTTVALAVEALDAGPPLVLRGPGIDGTRAVAPRGLPDDFLSQWGANRDLFPRGVDLLLVSGGSVIGLPRSTRIAMEAN